MLIDLKEVEEMTKQIPAFAKSHPGVKALIMFVTKTVKHLNAMDERLKKLENDGTK